MQNKARNTMIRNWSIEQGDYVRKGLSSGEKYYKTKVSLPVKILIIIMSVLVVVLGFVLHMKNTPHF